jgi:hypothetical protein
MVKTYQSSGEERAQQLEFCFDQPPAPTQPRNSQLEDILAHSTIPEFVREAKPFLEYPHPKRVPEILLEYFPGQFGKKQVLNPDNIMSLKTITRRFYNTYSSWLGYLEGAISYCLDNAYLTQNTQEKQDLMEQYLGKRVQTKIQKLKVASDYPLEIGLLFREQVLHYQELISKGNRKK